MRWHHVDLLCLCRCVGKLTLMHMYKNVSRQKQMANTYFINVLLKNGVSGNAEKCAFRGKALDSNLAGR